jgi:hypothetical protein
MIVSNCDDVMRAVEHGKTYDDYFSREDLGRILGDLEMDDSSSIDIEDDHGIRQLKRRGRDHYHMSTAAMAVIRFRRRLRQVGEGALRRGQGIRAVGS